MSRFARHPLSCAVASSLLGFGCIAGALAQQDDRPLATRWAVDYAGSAELGVGYVSDENFEFGEYNGLNQDGAVLIGNIDWTGSSDSSRWGFSANNLGLDTREGSGRWSNNRWEVFFEVDAQQQVRNNSGRTPFRGGDELGLPSDWVSGVTTADFANLDGSLRSFDPVIERDRYTLGLKAKLNEAWSIEGSAFYEGRDGNRDLGASIFNNVSAGDAAILPMPVDYDSTEFNLAVNYAKDSLALTGSLFYSDFDNGNEQLQWQNPYSNFGPNVRFPDGVGGMSLAPDNTFLQGRLMGTWILSPKLRLQLDGSFGRTEQDQDFLPFTANPNLTVSTALPRSNLGGEAETRVLDGRLFWTPLRRLRLEAYFHGEERDFDVPRDGYQYVLGDAWPINDPSGRLFNTAHSYSFNTYGVEGSYPLPLRSKIWLSYEFEEAERDNAAVMQSDEDRYKLRYRLPIAGGLNMRLEALYGDRDAEEYVWDQSYFARVDVERINATPDSQRFLNHPALSQYHIATREQLEAKLDFDWQLGMDWNLALNMLYRENDYDETDLGLTDEELESISFTASWVANNALVLTAWASGSTYSAAQNGRAFNGGIESNPFEIFPPLPQASDPARDWRTDTEDRTLLVGFGVEWQISDTLELSANYSYQDTESSYDFANGGASDLSADPLPVDFETQMHSATVEGSWHFRENISIALNYQYWNFESEDWAAVTPNSIDKVLALGLQPANEDLHYIGTSIVYRWQ